MKEFPIALTIVFFILLPGIILAILYGGNFNRKCATYFDGDEKKIYRCVRDLSEGKDPWQRYENNDCGEVKS